MARRKVVGITCSSDRIGDWRLPMDYVRIAYSRACEIAGLLPILLPVTEDADVRAGQLDLIDGLLLSGGDDVHPRFYGEGDAVHPATEPPDERRDVHEIALVHEALARDVPILAICRGLQILNVALGGALIQDLPRDAEAAWSHQQKALSWEKTHRVHVAPGTTLARIYDGADLPAINSHHHQAVRAAAPDLTVAARADDGVIEALELPAARFAVAVQWHPENLYETDAPSRALFAAFAAALENTPHAE